MIKNTKQNKKQFNLLYVFKKIMTPKKKILRFYFLITKRTYSSKNSLEIYVIFNVRSTIYDSGYSLLST